MQADPLFPFLTSAANSYDYCDQDPVNCNDLSGLAPQPETLSAAEDEAIYNKEHGLPYDKAIYKAAMQKVIKAQKYAGVRNAQKRGNPSNNPNPAGQGPETSESVLSQQETAYLHSFVDATIAVAAAAGIVAIGYFVLIFLGFI